MSDTRNENEASPEAGAAPEAVVVASRWHPLAAAAVVGGALAATAGALVGTRAMARRNGVKDGKVSSVMATAMTACDVAQKKQEPLAVEVLVHPPKGA